MGELLQVVTHVAIDGALLLQGRCASESGPEVLAVNRLIWGGLQVAIVHDSSDATQAPVAPGIAEGRVQHLQCDLKRQEQEPCAPSSLASCLSGWAAAAGAGTPADAPPASSSGQAQQQHPPTAMLAVCSVDALPAWAAQVDSDSQGALMLWAVDGSADERSSGSSAGARPHLVMPSLAQLPAALARHQQRSCQAQGLRCELVAHCMAPKRERELATLSGTGSVYTGGLLCLVPQRGLVFMPLDLDADLDSQAPFQVLLHKASDELCVGEDGRPCFSARIQRLRQWLAGRTGGDVRVVDPLECAVKVIDRVALCQVTDQLGSSQAPCVAGSSQGTAPQQVEVRAPRYCVLDSWADAHQVASQVAAAGLVAPFMVKASEACGLPHSHRMALVLGLSALAPALQALGLRPPVVVQEFRNHGGQVGKVYVAGTEVFHAIKPSIPDIPPSWFQAWSSSGEGSAPDASSVAQHLLCQAGFLVFDSLKSLPTTSWQEAAACGASSEGSGAGVGQDSSTGPQLQRVLEEAPGALEAAAAQLRALLGLSLFGFDVIAADGGDQGGVAHGALHVIDVNYLPNYRVPGAADHVWGVLAGGGGTS